MRVTHAPALDMEKQLLYQRRDTGDAAGASSIGVDGLACLVAQYCHRLPTVRREALAGVAG